MFSRRFFILVLTLNFIGFSFAIADLWPYAKKYPSALVLGNLNFAILMRNEVFGRILYLFVNTCFAKVCPPVSWVARGKDITQGFTCSGPLFGGALRALLCSKYVNVVYVCC